MGKRSMPERYDLFSANILSPAMLNSVSERLGISTDSLERLGIGYRPSKQAFVFPERDTKGNIIGMVERYNSDKKACVAGSKRGLIYEVNPGYNSGEQKYNPGKHNWKRIQEVGVLCPICGKPDWCLVSADNPNDPSAVVCSRKSEGSTKHIEEVGYVHILKPEGKISNSASGLLMDSDYPVVVTEGYSDTAATMDLGLVVLGRANAGTIKGLREILRGREVIIVGDNDDNKERAGQVGMESAFETLKSVCPKVTKVLPPGNYKDIRSWKLGDSLDRDGFLKYIAGYGVSTSSSECLEDGSSYFIAKEWIDREHTQDDLPTLRSYYGQWMEYSDGHYNNIDRESFRGMLYRFLEDKKVPKLGPSGDINMVPYEATRRTVGDIVDALSAWCPISRDAPCWLEDVGLPEPKNLIAFNNGLLDVNEYIKGKVVLHPATPALFSFNVIPYDFDEDAESPLWEDFLNDALNHEEDKINLVSEWFGYNCVPDMSMEKMTFLVGKPRSGKGTIINSMAAMLGDNQCVSMSFQDLCENFGYQPMIGKLAVLFPDAKSPRKARAASALEKMLQVVGRDPVGVRRMYLPFLPQVYLSCRFTMGMNELPDLPDQSNALGPRLNTLLFPNTYVGREDFKLKPTLVKEASQGKLINFALRGLKRLRENKGFSVPASSDSVLKQMREISSPLSMFITDCCSTEPPSCNGAGDNYRELLDTLYEAWVHWCEDSGIRSTSKNRFGRDVLECQSGIEVIRVMDDGIRYRFYRGVKLLESVKDKYGLRI